MRRTRIGAAFAGIAIAALALTACNSGTPGADPGTGDGDADSGALFEVAEGFTLEGSPTFDAMVARGGVDIGIREDQPGLGYLDAATQERTGFDVDIARWIAASLGFGEDQLNYTAVASANREQAIINGDIDYMVGTYSITDSRKEQVDFAGPYFLTGQSLLVASDSDITGQDDLVAGVNVCSVTGSTPIQRIREENPEATITEFDTYSQCVESLRSGQVDAVTTDAAILLGYAAQFPDEIVVAGEPFSEERYGIGLPLGDEVLRTHINDLFEDNPEIWQAIFDANLGASGTEVAQPAVDRY